MTFQNNTEFVNGNLSYKIIGCAFKVHNQLGGGHLESVYQKALDDSLKNAKLDFKAQKYLPVKYLNSKITDYKPDFIVEDQVVVDIKRHKKILIKDFEQVKRYLKETSLKLGLLIHFGADYVKVKRVVNLE